MTVAASLLQALTVAVLAAGGLAPADSPVRAETASVVEPSVEAAPAAGAARADEAHLTASSVARRAPAQTADPAATPEARSPAVAQKPAIAQKAVPIRLTIPALGVDASVVELGLDSDGELATPADFDTAGWYTDGPEPGEVGPSVIAGHVDDRSGPAVFFGLRDLTAGDEGHRPLRGRHHHVLRRRPPGTAPQGCFPHRPGLRRHRGDRPPPDLLRRELRPRPAQIPRQRDRLRHRPLTCDVLHALQLSPRAP